MVAKKSDTDKGAAPAAEDAESLLPEAARQLLHELRAHQIQLETQNEELRKAQRELDAARARYFDLYDLAPVGYCTVSEKGRILEANLAAAQLLGATKDALDKLPFSRYLHPEDQDAFHLRSRQILKTGDPQVFELRMARTDGTALWVRLEASRARDTDGRAVCRVVLSDITARREAEEALTRRVRISGIFLTAHEDDMFDAVLQVVLEALGSPLGVFGYLDSAGGLLVPALVRPARGARLHSEETRALPPEAWGDSGWGRALLEKEANTSTQLSADGGAADFFRGCGLIRGQINFPVLFRGEVIGLFIVANRETEYTDRDIAVLDGIAKQVAPILGVRLKRKWAEAEKERMEAQYRLLQKSESLGCMAGAIAHHFNNQLQVVLGSLEMVRDTLPPDAESARDLDAAMRAAGKAAEVSGLMLTYLGQSLGKREPLDLAELCRRTLPLLQTVLPTNVALEAECPAPGPVVAADPNQMRQILTNLATNAWEAVADRAGVVRLAVKTAAAAAISDWHRFPVNGPAPHDGYACLEVADTGDGISPKDIDNLFDPFFSSKFSGRGLGLSVVLGIVRAHGGVVTVESEPGRGSIFRVYLPLTEEAILRPPEKAPDTAAFERGGTVLLVDDEETVREVAAAMLTRLGFEVLAARDGVEAVELFRRHRDRIRWVLCDLTMPRMDGWQTLEALRRLAPGIPVVLASGYSKEQVLAGRHSELPQAILGKPFQREDLAETIQRALQAQAPGEPAA